MNQKSLIIEKQRVDKWLWHARFFKTRSTASKIIRSGKVFLDQKRITKTHAMLSFGSKLIFTQGNKMREVEVLSMINCRVGAKESEKLFKDLSVDELNQKKIQENKNFCDKRIGKGRPTKKDRRLINKFRNNYI